MSPFRSMCIIVPGPSFNMCVCCGNFSTLSTKNVPETSAGHLIIQLCSDTTQRPHQIPQVTILQDCPHLLQTPKQSKVIDHLCFWLVLSHSVWPDSATPWIVALQAPLSMGILQATILEWVAMPSSRGFSQLRDWAQVSHIACRFFTNWAIREA